MVVVHALYGLVELGRNAGVHARHTRIGPGGPRIFRCHLRHARLHNVFLAGLLLVRLHVTGDRPASIL